MRKYSRRTSLESLIARSVPSPVFEFTPERIEKIKVYSDALMMLLRVATVMTMIVVAPNALQALDIFETKRGKKKLTHEKKIRKIARTFRYLRRWGRIEFRKKGDNFEIRLTDEGKKFLRKLDLDYLEIPKPKVWDGKFWQVAADIPTKKYRKGADALRRKLREMNFYPLQRTLWFYPHDPRVEIEFVTRHYGIANFVTVMKIEKLDPEDEQNLLRSFKEAGIV